MFVNFFYHLRARGIPVGTTEFLSLLTALEKGLAAESLERFYAVARAVCVKRVEHFDLYDQAFAEFFKDSEFTYTGRTSLEDEVYRWLENGKVRELTAEERAMLDAMSLDAEKLDELRRRFEERLQEQTERHEGGNKWVGTGGTSAFGHSGFHPGGIRVGGEDRPGRGSAVQVASKRRFYNMRNDLTLDTRQIGLALRNLRELVREGAVDELDLEESIAETARNAGEIELVFRAPRKNNVKLLLLMDAGGSMNPHAWVTSQLFSAAHKANHFKAFKSYYFHNCPYEFLFTDMEREEKISTVQVLAELDSTWRCIIVGDAAMAPSELMEPGGSVDYFHFNPEPGIAWLQRFREVVPRTAWLNPDSPRWWGGYTTRVIGSLFPMFPMTLEGLEDAVAEIRRP